MAEEFQSVGVSVCFVWLANFLPCSLKKSKVSQEKGTLIERVASWLWCCLLNKALLVPGTTQTGNATFQIFLVVFSIAARAVSVIIDSWVTRKKWLLLEKWVFFLGRVFFLFH